jgi:ketosteroid isomerase-like protein
MNHREFLQSYLETIASGETADGLAVFFHPEVVQEEFPNRLLVNGTTRDLAAILEGAKKGQAILVRQTLDLVAVVSQGETAAVEARWSGSFKVPIGSLNAGDTMRARFAMFFEFRDGLIWRQRNYDCFDPF